MCVQDQSAIARVLKTVTYKSPRTESALQKLAAAAPHSEWRNFAERACIEGGAADPAFMRNTNASLLHQQTRESELKTSLVDRDQQKAVHSEVIEAHEADLRADRAADPGRYATMSGYGGSITASQKLLRGPPKPIAQAMETAAVRFQEVKVKPVDQNIAQLRASREASSLAQLSGAGGSGVGVRSSSRGVAPFTGGRPSLSRKARNASAGGTRGRPSSPAMDVPPCWFW